MSKTIKATAKRYRYTGMERDEESGLSYHSARYYLPWLGRWLSGDPIGIGDGVNVYAYVGNSPTQFIDKNGLCKNKNMNILKEMKDKDLEEESKKKKNDESKLKLKYDSIDSSSDLSDDSSNDLSNNFIIKKNKIYLSTKKNFLISIDFVGKFQLNQDPKYIEKIKKISSELYKNGTTKDNLKNQESLNFSINKKFFGTTITHLWGEIGEHQYINAFGIISSPKGKVLGGFTKKTGDVVNWNFLAGLKPTFDLDSLSHKTIPLILYSKGEINFNDNVTFGVEASYSTKGNIFIGNIYMQIKFK